jgi:hypothetical protein
MINVVQKITDNLKKSETVKFELNEESIKQIMAIVMQIVNALKECKKTPEQATVDVNNPTRLQKVVVKKAVRNQLGFWKNRKDGGEYYDAVLKAGYGLNVNDVQEAYQAK